MEIKGIVNLDNGEVERAAGGITPPWPSPLPSPWPVPPAPPGTGMDWIRWEWFLSSLQRPGVF